MIKTTGLTVGERLMKLSQRVTVLHGFVVDKDGKRVPLSDYVRASLKTLAETQPDPAKVIDLIRRSAGRDTEARAQLNALRVDAHNSYILADSNFLPFFDVVNLANGDRPLLRNETKQRVHVGALTGQNNKPSAIKVEKDMLDITVPLVPLSTEEVWYYLMDIYNGDISEVARNTIDLSADFSRLLDKRAYTLLTATVANGGAFGAFDFNDPNKLNWVYIAHADINTANLPQTNDVVVPGSNANSKFRFGVFRAIINYCNLVGKNFPGGPLKPTGEVYVPALHASDIAEEIVPTGNTGNKVADQLMEEGPARIGYMGINWTIIPDNTLDPAAGFCYPRFNKPVGTVYFKPGMDKDIISSSSEDEHNDIERRYLKKVVGMAVPSWKRMNIARFRYKVPA